MIAHPASIPFAPRALAPVLEFQAAATAPAATLLFVVGATHRTAPLALRERLALKAEAEARLAGEMARIAGLREFVILATCNRLELYGVAHHPSVLDAAEHALAAGCGVSRAEFAQVRQCRQGRDAVRHLLEVAAGLDSQMLGETEIFGQVKRAYAAAQSRDSAGPALNRIFQKVFQGAKHVRTHTAITVGQVSVANVAVDLALKIFGDLQSARVLLLGAGEIGEKTARAFASRGARALSVANRHRERADALAAGLSASSLDFAEREARLGEFDIVVSATAALGTVVSAAAARAALRVRPARPMLLVDLALPRDIEPAAAEIPNVFLYNLDDLARIAEDNRAARAAEIAKCQGLVAARADAIWRQAEAPSAGNRAALAS
ncbi:MAG TPA: glutamyl-tRNA reductase [Opitutaceae bacterium]|nr:glutamyl-tRNA reductase [Opitutaceae bacterium]